MLLVSISTITREHECTSATRPLPVLVHRILSTHDGILHHRTFFPLDSANYEQRTQGEKAEVENLEEIEITVLVQW